MYRLRYNKCLEVGLAIGVCESRNGVCLGGRKNSWLIGALMNSVANVIPSSHLLGTPGLPTLNWYFVRYIKERLRIQQAQGSKYAPAYIEPQFDD